MKFIFILFALPITVLATPQFPGVSIQCEFWGQYHHQSTLEPLTPKVYTFSNGEDKPGLIKPDKTIYSIPNYPLSTDRPGRAVGWYQLQVHIPLTTRSDEKTINRLELVMYKRGGTTEQFAPSIELEYRHDYIERDDDGKMISGFGDICKKSESLPNVQPTNQSGDILIDQEYDIALKSGSVAHELERIKIRCKL